MTQCSTRAPGIASTLMALLCPVLLVVIYSLPTEIVLPAQVSADSSEDAESVCVIEEPGLTESSGIAISRSHEQSLWIHNDSGDSARLFLVGFNGRTKAIISVRDVKPMDWEDMCSFELDGEKWLMIGDIGDNGRVRGKSAPLCKLLLLKEPGVELIAASSAEPAHLELDVVSFTEFGWPEDPQDCESLAVDTKRREILLMTKARPSGCGLFRLPLTLKPGEHRAQAEIVTAIGVPWATAMDVSADGLKMIAVNMISGAFIERSDAESWKDACQRPATVLTLPPRRQGESVCFDLDGQSLLLNSEGQKQPLWRVRLPKSEPP